MTDCLRALLKATVVTSALAVCAATPPARAANPAAAPAPSGDELLKRVDQQANAFNDATFEFKMLIKEPSGQIREVDFLTLQKGLQKRLVRFTGPGDVKGMGFLMESSDTMYALLPAFGNRVRRIGTHQMAQSFMGSDIQTADMSAVEFSAAYNAKVLGTEGDLTVLDLTLKPGLSSETPHLKMWVDSKLLINKIEYYEASGKKLRTQLRGDFRQEAGANYSAPYKMTFIDHRRNDHQTELIMVKRQVNTGLKDEEFTTRALQRN